jgi:hypothetical chaperone protein
VKTVRVGIDFGTTNSAVAVVGPGGEPEMVELFAGEPVQRTVLYADPEGEVSFGNPAFRNYIENDLTGRFLRSLKMFLPEDVPNTTFAGRRMAFTDLIASYLRFLVDRTEAVTGYAVGSVVLGRPVRFSDDAEKNQLALDRLAQAGRDAGLPDVSFVLEPVAAAHRYERGLSGERIVLVGDFGGGTADFAILRVGPERIGRDRTRDVLAQTGVAGAGDALDGRFLDVFLLDFFGRRATVRERYTDNWIPWEHPLHRQIQQLYSIHLLRDDDLERRLARVRDRVSDTAALDRLTRLVFDDLGYPMAWAIERTKRALSEHAEADFAFREFFNDRLDFETGVDRASFADGTRDLQRRWAGAVDDALREAGLEARAIDEVFLTGGTSQLPFVQHPFAERFGVDRLRSGDAFTSVCEGLALAGGNGR